MRRHDMNDFDELARQHLRAIMREEDAPPKYKPEDYEAWYHKHAEPTIGPLNPNMTLFGDIAEVSHG